MSLQSEVLAVLRHERTQHVCARLNVRELARKVERGRWAKLSPAERIFHFMLGSNLCPSEEEVHDAVHDLQNTHPNLVSLRRTHWPRQGQGYVRLVHTR